MSVWPEVSLSTREGNLISVSLNVDPRQLESLLESLAQVPFPINPQIYHDAAIVYEFADHHEEVESTTLVEFPAFEARLDTVRRALDSYGFDPAILHVTSMLDEIHEASVPEPPPAGAPYVSRRRTKYRTVAAH